MSLRHQTIRYVPLGTQYLRSWHKAWVLSRSVEGDHVAVGIYDQCWSSNWPFLLKPSPVDEKQDGPKTRCMQKLGGVCNNDNGKRIFPVCTNISPDRISRRNFFLFSQSFYKDELGPIKIVFYSFFRIVLDDKAVGHSLVIKWTKQAVGRPETERSERVVFCHHVSNVSNFITRLLTCESPVFGQGWMLFYWSSHCGHKTPERDELLWCFWRPQWTGSSVWFLRSCEARFRDESLERRSQQGLTDKPQAANIKAEGARQIPLQFFGNVGVYLRMTVIR